jgi:hypothetical protein
MKLDSGTLFVVIFCSTAILVWAVWVGTQLHTDSEVQEVIGSCVAEESVIIHPTEGLRDVEEVCLNNIVYYKFRHSLSTKFVVSSLIGNKPLLEQC